MDGAAIVWCAGAFGTPEGKTAHGLVRFTERYRVLRVIDPVHAGRDAGNVLDGRPCGIPVVATPAEAIALGGATHFVIGLAPDGGRLPAAGRAAALEALRAGLNVDSGLHDFLSDDAELAAVARARGAGIRDVRKTPDRALLHGFTGQISRVEALKVAMLGTDSAVGKRTTAWLLVQALRRAEVPAEMVGTGQTAWLQGVKHGLILDSLINDFVSGELEHATGAAWDDRHPRVIAIEGQGSLLNPAYPGGLEILAACRPEVIVLQHAPGRPEYDGFPGYPIEPIEHQIRCLELLSRAKVVAVTVNHEGLSPDQVPAACAEIERRTGLPCCDPLLDGMAVPLRALAPYLK
jgi:uncharacterized NAD-dependent epimerase/dehydratase family protein